MDGTEGGGGVVIEVEVALKEAPPSVVCLAVSRVWLHARCDVEHVKRRRRGAGRERAMGWGKAGRADKSKARGKQMQARPGLGEGEGG